MADSQPKVAFFKKGKSRPANNRKRSPSPSGASAAPVAGPSTVVLPTKKHTGNLLSAGTKRTTTQRDALDEEERDGPDVKWSASGSHTNAALEILAGDEAEELLAKRMKKAPDGDEDDRPQDGLYHGQGAYKSHLKKNQEVPKAMRVGPQRSNNSTIRTVTIVDYQPDVCKDYKETGYCGFGDTCKFLHDRGTYLAGWQLDKLAEEAKRKPGDESESDSDSDEDLPFACLICRKPFTDPVVTRCGHYYCSACAIKRYAKTPKCLACGTPTGGLFNRADKVIAKMKEKERLEKEEGDGGGDDDGNGGGSGVQLEGLEEGGGSENDGSQSDDE
ncbi:hypothetical protein SCHPADRAFT_941824 [Schizopora paradoxa]|uniref:Pre-mRNA-splicing factor CWC24 n=1 Tax=Schizopora paradoxa TaxID=27342 RepID=A0A0H2RIT5_9AGAM|nr:hypothetical protein SCHPADRAFT_941824 [Schizopora paradoxa]